MDFVATRKLVGNRGAAPVSFLTELIAWGKAAPEEVFAPNPNPLEIYTLLRPELGPWRDPLDRRAAMLEAMRVHAGFESSWQWQEGVDTTNATSEKHITAQEAGIFQVSFNSEWLCPDLRAFLSAHGVHNPPDFIAAMKSNHPLGVEYYARLVRVNIRWAGPLIRHEIDPYLSRDAMAEFRGFLTA